MGAAPLEFRLDSSEHSLNLSHKSAHLCLADCFFVVSTLLGKFQCWKVTLLPFQAVPPLSGTCIYVLSSRSQFKGCAPQTKTWNSLSRCQMAHSVADSYLVGRRIEVWRNETCWQLHTSFVSQTDTWLVFPTKPGTSLQAGHALWQGIQTLISSLFMSVSCLLCWTCTVFQDSMYFALP